MTLGTLLGSILALGGVASGVAFMLWCTAAVARHDGTAGEPAGRRR